MIEDSCITTGYSSQVAGIVSFQMETEPRENETQLKNTGNKISLWIRMYLEKRYFSDFDEWGNE